MSTPPSAASRGPDPAPAGDADAVGFVLAYGRALAGAGYPTHWLEEVLDGMSARLGLRGQFFVTPTSIFASFGPDERQHTHLIRVEPGAPDLGEVAAIEPIADAVGRGTMTPRDGLAALARVAAAPPPYGLALTMLASMVSSGCAARFLGGTWREIAAAAAAGALVALAPFAARRSPSLARVAEAATAFAIAFALTALARLGFAISTTLATLAALIALLPGLTLTAAMAELAARHLVSGTSRFVGSLMTLVGLAFGVALGDTAGGLVFGVASRPHPAPAPLPMWTEWLGLVLAPLAFTVLMRGRFRHALWVLLVCVVGFYGGRLGARVFGPELGIVLGSFGAALAANTLMRAGGVSSGVTLPPALLLLVPGSIGFRGLALLLDERTLDGVQAAFRMVIMLSALVVGLFAATAIVPPRRRAP